MFHSISVPSDFLESSLWHILKESREAMMIKLILTSNYSKQEMDQTNIYL
jgi:hypothetical protein